MSVNVSAAQFALPDFSAKVAAALAKTGANPERLKLEITESMLLHNLDDVIGKMNCIRTLGVTFALDDLALATRLCPISNVCRSTNSKSTAPSSMICSQIRTTPLLPRQYWRLGTA
jgi:hypothetical protein